MKNAQKNAVLEPRERRIYHRELLLPYIDSNIRNKVKVAQAAEKMAYFLDDLFLKKNVVKQIISFRETFNIPKEGAKLTTRDLEKILEQPFYLPDINNLSFKKFRERLSPIEKRIPMQSFNSISIILRLFALYNLYDLEFALYLFSEEGPCRLVNIKEELEDYQPNNKKTTGYYLDHLKQESEYYPLHIRVSPYAGQRDINDYIKANWKTIKNELTKVNPPNRLLGKIKKKDIELRERNKFIYENRHLPETEIRALVKKYFGKSFYMGEIRRIVSREDKRRQDV